MMTLGTTFDVSRGFVSSCENSGGLNDNVSANLTPWNLSWVTLGVDVDFMSVDDDFAVLLLNASLESSVG